MYKPAEANLEKGDVISVAYSNQGYLAFFHSYGSRGNARFYMISFVASRLKYYENALKEGRKAKVYLDYINTHANERIFPVDVSKLPEKLQIEIEELNFKLREKGLL